MRFYKNIIKKLIKGWRLELQKKETLGKKTHSIKTKGSKNRINKKQI